MAEQSDERTSTVPLIVGMLAALTVGYWLFLGGKTADQTAGGSKPPATAQR